MIIKVITIFGEEIQLNHIFEFCFTQTVGVACDSLSVYFKNESPIDEIAFVKAYEKDKIIFNGFCDNQRTTENQDGFEMFIYARASACLLVDNEAQPFTYNCPSANQLYFNYAKDFGFESSLPEIYSNDKYEVLKGTTCYGAIHQFVYLKSGKYVYVTPDNKLSVYEKSSNIRDLHKYNIISFSSVINRSEPISQINFKRSVGESGYRLHTKSQISDEIGIKRNQYVNLSALPQWQREYIILQKLKSSYEDYKVLEIMVAGYVDEELFRSFDFVHRGVRYDDYVLMEKKYTFDERGERTKLVMKKSVEVKEITYVD